VSSETIVRILREGLPVDPDPFRGADARQYDGRVSWLVSSRLPLKSRSKPSATSRNWLRVCHSSNYGTVDTEPGGAIHHPFV
jgi:hypothetical protein